MIFCQISRVYVTSANLCCIIVEPTPKVLLFAEPREILFLLRLLNVRLFSVFKFCPFPRGNTADFEKEMGKGKDINWKNDHQKEALRTLQSKFGIFCWLNKCIAVRLLNNSYNIWFGLVWFRYLMAYQPLLVISRQILFLQK